MAQWLLSLVTQDPSQMNRTDNPSSRRKPTKPIGDHTVEMATRELYKQMLQDQQPRPRQRTTEIDGDHAATTDLGALFHAVRTGASGFRDVREDRDFPPLDATLP
jgi:hypothetical protein